jgi:hypothetical protein
LLRDAVVQRVKTEACFIHLRRREDSNIREDPLAGPRIGRAAVQREARVDRQLVGPAITAEPLRFRALVEVDTLIELYLVTGVFTKY